MSDKNKIVELEARLAEVERVLAVQLSENRRAEVVKQRERIVRDAERAGHDAMLAYLNAGDRTCMAGSCEMLGLQ